jgi:hypothetical protein
MKETTEQAIQSAALRILRPLVRVMLNHGMAYGAFAELARKAFVEEGFDYLQRSNQRPTDSGISALTGLTRKETKRLREEGDEADGDSGHRYSRAIRVISGWVNDTRFQDAKGEPAVLPIAGDKGSFSALVNEFSGDVPTGAMLSLLESSRNVARRDDHVELVERAYIPMGTPVEKINILGTDVAELIGTIGHNLEVGPEHRLFQRKVSNTLVRADAIDEFRELSNKKSQELLEEYHRWLSSHEVAVDGNPSQSSGYVAVGIYYVEHSEGGE